METITTPQKCGMNILSNIILSDDIFTVDYQVHRETKAPKSAKSEEPPVLFRNLAFELPLPKRKNSVSDRETAKKQRTQLGNDDCGHTDNVVKVFNYLTGTYESVEETVKEEDLEDSLDNEGDILSINESTLIEEHTLIRDDPLESLEEYDFECVDESDDMEEHVTVGHKDDALINVGDVNLTVAASGGGEATSENNNGKITREIENKRFPCFENKTLKVLLVRENFDRITKYDVPFNCFIMANNKTKENNNITSEARPQLDVIEHNSQATSKRNRKITLERFPCFENKILNFDRVTKRGVVFNCFDCDAVFDNRKELAAHVHVSHSTSVFKCDLHYLSGKECSKCVYESVLNDFRSNVHIEGSGGSLEMVNSNCLKRFSTAKQSRQKSGRTTSHQATVEIDENGGMEENNGASEVIDDNDVMSETVIEHNSELTSGVQENSGLEANKQKSDGAENEYIDVDDDHDSGNTNLSVSDVYSLDQWENFFNRNYKHDKVVENIETENDEGVNISEKHANKRELTFQCFDCRYSNVKDLSQFERHAMKHIGSKFRCMLHSDTSDNDCAKCFYESTLNDLEKFIADGRHSPEDVKCFHCPYVTSGKKFLYHHAAGHVYEDFACDKHVTSVSLDACLKCVYEYCLKMAKKYVLVCETCDFKTVVTAMFDVHRCNNSCIAPYTCWDCKLNSFNTIDELREHAVAHYKSEFRCKDHDSAVNSCYQCLYRALADSLESNVFVCPKCDFRSSSEECLAQHSCTVTLKFKCFHCDYQTNYKKSLKYHCNYSHYGETFACETHPKAPQVDCLKCVYQKLLSMSQKILFVCNECNFKTFSKFHFHSHKSNSHSTTPDLPFKCFDCTAPFNNVRSLKYHALCHINSKFKCTDHKSQRVPTCAKCIYEDIVCTVNTPFTCEKCCYNTYVWSNMKDHHCKALLALKPYTCFDCDFSHERLDSLKVHVKEHRASKFQCDEHKKPYADCPKCRYVKLVFATTRGRLCCYDCDKWELFVKLRDLRRHVVKEHPQSHFVCTLHIEKKDNGCGKCLYSEIVEDVLGDNYVKLICWDCDGNKLFSHIASCENHIVYLHLDSTFLCPEHCGRNYKRCSKCLYQKMLQRHSIVTPPPKSLMFQCFECDFTKKYLHIFIRHVATAHKNSDFKCDEHPDSCDNDKYCPQCFYSGIKSVDKSTLFYRCYECNLSNKCGHIRSLRKHVRKDHKKCSFVCTLHLNEGGTNCIKCYFEGLAQEVTQSSPFRYECFNCSYGSDSLNLFKSHVHQSHKDTKFSCRTHFKKCAIDCARCFYAAIVSEVSSNNIVCYACVSPTTPLPHLNALREHIVDKHETSAFTCPSHIIKEGDCDKCLFQRELEIIREQKRASLCCFDCNYKSDKFSALRYHVWRQHKDSQYQCEQHLIKTIDCQKCSHAAMIANLRNFTCYICETLPTFSGVHPLRSHIYKAHASHLFVCPDEHYSTSRNCGKCFFEKLIRDVFILQCCDCGATGSFRNEGCLKTHIEERHNNSKFVCNLHPLGPKWSTCSQCRYEKLVRASEPPANESFQYFKCFDCDYETDKDVIIRWHIRKEHSDSRFTCGTHSLSEIDRSCSKCRYENLILQVKENFVLSLSP